MELMFLDSITEHVILKEDEILVYLMEVDGTEDQELLRPFLNDDELKRAAQYKFDINRLEFMLSRAFVKKFLASILGLETTQIELMLGSYGKPLFENHLDIYFNISHSGGRIAIGFCKSRNIGIDIELIKYDFDILTIAERYFSPDELLVLSNVEKSSRFEAFFSCWTRKEAFLKAHGKGMSIPLSDFSVDFLAYDGQFLTYLKSIHGISKWQILPFPVSEDCKAAVCVDDEELFATDKLRIVQL